MFWLLLVVGVVLLTPVSTVPPGSPAGPSGSGSVPSRTAPSRVALIALALPLAGLRTGLPSIKVVPTSDSARVGYDLIQNAFGKAAPGTLQVVATSAQADATSAVLTSDPGIAPVMPAMPAKDGRVLTQAVPTTDPSAKDMGATIDRLRHDVPAGVLVAGAVAENHDLETLLRTRHLW